MMCCYRVYRTAATVLPLPASPYGGLSIVPLQQPWGTVDILYSIANHLRIHSVQANVLFLLTNAASSQIGCLEVSTGDRSPVERGIPWQGAVRAGSVRMRERQRNRQRQRDRETESVW